MGRAPLNETLEQRLVRYSSFDANGCRNWRGWKQQGGYGQVRFRWRKMQAHRAAYEVWVGKIPEGMCVLHRCDNPVCINPDHLWLGTPTDNMRDCMTKGRWQPYVRVFDHTSLKATKPWLALGMSRSTWYRHGKGWH